jgi:hypothetical protein
MLWRFQVLALTAGLFGYHGPLLWHMIPKQLLLHTSFIMASWQYSWVSRKVLIFTACSTKQVRCPFFPIGSDASHDSETVYFLQCITRFWMHHTIQRITRFWDSLLSSMQTILFLRKLCSVRPKYRHCV